MTETVTTIQIDEQRHVETTLDYPPQNKAAIKLIDDWFDGEPTEPTPEPEPFCIGAVHPTCNCGECVAARRADKMVLSHTDAEIQGIERNYQPAQVSSSPTEIMDCGRTESP